MAKYSAGSISDALRRGASKGYGDIAAAGQLKKAALQRKKGESATKLAALTATSNWEQKGIEAEAQKKYADTLAEGYRTGSDVPRMSIDAPPMPDAPMLPPPTLRPQSFGGPAMVLATLAGLISPGMAGNAHASAMQGQMIAGQQDLERRQQNYARFVAHATEQYRAALDARSEKIRLSMLEKQAERDDAIRKRAEQLAGAEVAAQSAKAGSLSSSYRAPFPGQKDLIAAIAESNNIDTEISAIDTETRVAAEKQLQIERALAQSEDTRLKNIQIDLQRNADARAQEAHALDMKRGNAELPFITKTKEAQLAGLEAGAAATRQATRFEAELHPYKKLQAEIQNKLGQQAIDNPKQALAALGKEITALTKIYSMDAESLKQADNDKSRFMMMWNDPKNKALKAEKEIVAKYQGNGGVPSTKPSRIIDSSKIKTPYTMQGLVGTGDVIQPGQKNPLTGGTTFEDVFSPTYADAVYKRLVERLQRAKESKAALETYLQMMENQVRGLGNGAPFNPLGPGTNILPTTTQMPPIPMPAGVGGLGRPLGGPR